MKILILHNRPSHDALADEQDVMDQVTAVVSSLTELGHETEVQACDLDLALVQEELIARAPDLVFNLVESLAKTDRLAPLVPMLLDALGIPYTGTRTWPLYRACSKLLTKECLRASGLPTALWFNPAENRPAPAFPAGSRVIVKPVWEHASFGMDDNSVVEADRGGIAVLNAIAERQRESGRHFFAEQFIDGREFNVSVIQSAGDPGSCKVLPPAEIRFVNFPSDRPKIVGHRAKWDGQSEEYQQTPRSFEFPPEDRGLLDELVKLTSRCWQVFELSGYARVDFRVDSSGKPWILEINANPCLTPDAGLAAAAEMAGLGFAELIDKIVHSALGQPETPRRTRSAGFSGRVGQSTGQK
jgi:D-alanine-D-alanine ligase